MNKPKEAIGNITYAIYDFICCWIMPNIITLSFFILPGILYAINWDTLGHIIYGGTICTALVFLVISIYQFIISFPQQNVDMRYRAMAIWAYLMPSCIIATLILQHIQTLS